MWSDYAYPGATIAFPGAEVPAELDPRFREHVEALFEFYLDRVPDGVINNRFDMVHQSSGEMYCDFVTPEYNTEPEGTVGGHPEGAEKKWEVCRGIGTSFGYNRQESDANYMSPPEVSHLLTDIVARGGNLLMNVGPSATGEIPWPQARRLLELGWWLRVNAQAIYGSSPWLRTGGVTGEGMEVRYTQSDDAVHAIVLGAPRTAVVELDLRLDAETEVSLHGRTGLVSWESTPNGVRVRLPEEPDERPALALRLSPSSSVRPT